MKTYKSRLALLSLIAPLSFAAYAQTSQHPNVIYIMADDMGIGDLGCYGQKQIHTPAIDSLASEGIRFTQQYAGAPVSAPSRCSLMTGKTTGHTYIRGNQDVKGPDGEFYDTALPKGEITVADIFKQNNYVTACIGKWGLGGPESEGLPNKHGFDYFFGYLGQLNAHHYYPRFMWENEKKLKLDGKYYSHDLMMEKALGFISKNADKPFFLYLTPTIPHAELIVPKGQLGQYDHKFMEKPYIGSHYCSQPQPQATYAAMISRLDSGVGQIMKLLKEKGIDKNTIVIFTSDNGVHAEGGLNPDFFRSNGGFRGIKRDVYEGGIRTPFIVRWPGHIKPGSVTFHVAAFWDFMPTICDLLHVQVPVASDGVSYLPALTGVGEQKKHDYLYWEFYEDGGKRAVLRNNWKLMELNINRPDKTTWELYNLSTDPTERANVIAQYPEKVRELKAIMDQASTPNPIWHFNRK